jgi:hypothetical protein
VFHRQALFALQVENLYLAMEVLPHLTTSNVREWGHPHARDEPEIEESYGDFGNQPSRTSIWSQDSRILQ